MIEVAIVGGGPGGLMTAWQIRNKIGDMARVTLFEMSNRLGGKILTRRFDTAPAMYEAGVAELYDYSMLGHDPLRELIQGFGLQTVPMDSDFVAMEGKLINGAEGMRRHFGDKTADAILRFRRKCETMLSREQYYEGIGKQDNEHPWATIDAEKLLDQEVSDPVAKRFFKTMARSDIASEPHLTNGLNALKNFLMDVDGYIGLYSIQNGNEQLVEGLKSTLTADVRFNHQVKKIDVAENGRYRVSVLNGKGPETHDFDIVAVCLPHNWLSTVQWGNETLRRAMVKHIAHFDRPAHYLRVAALFDKPFWEKSISDAWFMSDAFGGCCVYIEGARHDVGKHGVLNWLIAGSDALAHVNCDDEMLADMALKTLPAAFANAREHLLEIKTHRWISSVNAVPGGLPVRNPAVNHKPEPKEHPGLVVVGDYLFDSTLNGLLDSSDMATDMILTQMMKRRYETGVAKATAAMEPNPVVVPEPSSKIDRTYFDKYRGVGPYADVWSRFSDPDYILDVIRMVWGLKGDFRMLVTGSASGELVGALRARGVKAKGVENNDYILGKTPKALRKFNLEGSVVDLPFGKGAFDIVYDTALPYVAEGRLPTAISELHRVATRGVYFAGVTSDLTSDVCDMYDLWRGVRKFATWWEWSELFFNEDFDLALDNRDVLDAVWERTLAAGKGVGAWYEDSESLRYCFFDRLKSSA